MFLSRSAAAVCESEEEISRAFLAAPYYTQLEPKIDVALKATATIKVSLLSTSRTFPPRTSLGLL